MTFHLSYKPPFDWSFLLRYFATRSTPGVEIVAGERYSRTVSIEGHEGVLQVEDDPVNHRLMISADPRFARYQEQIAACVRQMFDLAANIEAVNSVLSADSRLALHIRAYPGIRVPGAWSAFEVIARAIIGQQISVKGASTIIGRVAERCGKSISSADGLRFVFPSPHALAEADLSNIGLPGKRVEALQNLARKIAEGAIPFSQTSGSIAEIREALLNEPGIGPWTVEYFALRALRDPDAWPGTDLVLRRAISREPNSRLSQTALVEATAMWRPWRSYAAVHIWNAAALGKEFNDKSVLAR